MLATALVAQVQPLRLPVAGEASLVGVLRGPRGLATDAEVLQAGVAVGPLVVRTVLGWDGSRRLCSRPHGRITSRKGSG